MNWMNQPCIRAATHAAPHHLDELTALALLHRWGRERGRRIESHFLTRQEIATDFNAFDVLIDIGQQYDPMQGRFDHHQEQPELAGRAAAGLVFDTLFPEDPRRAYLEPMIRLVDAIDLGVAPRAEEAAGRASGFLSLTALLKAIGGFQPNIRASRRCARIIRDLVDHWFGQSEAYLGAADAVREAEKIGNVLLLPDDSAYGPAFLSYLAEERPEFVAVGFPGGPERFQLVATRDQHGNNRVQFPPQMEGASFVHPKGFLAVFPSREAARAALAGLGAAGDA